MIRIFDISLSHSQKRPHQGTSIFGVNKMWQRTILGMNAVPLQRQSSEHVERLIMPP